MNKHIDFTGYDDPRKDLIVFLELAREFGFKVILRPGPRINGQWRNGGLPDFLFNDIKILARDSEGQEIRLEKDAGVEGGYLPSYLHPHYLHYLRNYFKTFVETTKNYIYPRGPIFMIEIDFETAFGESLDPASADYNKDVLAKYYPGFLASRYEDIKKLNQTYREKNPDFESVDPPRNFADLDVKDMPKFYDWLRFRELILKAYLSTLEEIIKSYTVEPMFFRSLNFGRGDLLPSFNLTPSEHEAMLGANVFPKGTYFDLAQKGRYLKGEHNFAWASSFISGFSATEEDLRIKRNEYPDGLRRFYLVAGLASGFKGLNHYMFVNRDHWGGAPLDNDGTITSGYEVIKKFNAAILNIKVNELESTEKICVIGNRTYQQLSLAKNPKQFGYINQLLSGSVNGFCRDLLRLKLDYVIKETINLDELKKYDLVFMPSAEFMSEEMQEMIVEMLKKGINVIMCGLMPKYDDKFKDCPILSRHMRIKTTLGPSIDLARHKTGQFTTGIYGHILSTDARVKKLVTVKKKAIGVASSKYKGTLYLFTFDIGSDGNHNKMVYLESLLADHGIVPFMYCSDSSIDLVIHKADKKAVLYMIAPPPGELSSLSDTTQRDVILSLDLRKVGIASAKIKMIDLFAGEEESPVTVTADSLRKGIPVSMSFPDGRMFLLQKK